ncbi:MAG: serine protease, partial [Streptomyces sp.]
MDGQAFEEIFPRFGGLASAVLAEGVLVPAGEGFRFADEEFADWLQGRHLDVDAALDTLVHHQAGQDARVPVPMPTPTSTPTPTPTPPPAAMPRHRIGPVVQALLLCAQLDGPNALERRLRPLVEAGGAHAADRDVAWWAGHLLGETLLGLPDARPYSGVLCALAERITAEGHSGDFGPWFWRRLPLPTPVRIELLRLLLPVDAPHGADGGRGGERYLDVVGELLATEPRTVQPLLCAWFTDQRPLRRRADARGALQPTVASAAQALLHTHRGRATDDLLDLLIGTDHPRAEELLTEFVHDEPAALCRAVDRWAHDERAGRRAAAAAYGVRTWRHARTHADRELLQQAALALLRHPDEAAVHGTALALLVRDQDRRDQHLDAALAHLAATGAPELAGALAETLDHRPEPVLAAFRARLHEPGTAAHAVLAALADVRDPELAIRVAALVREYAELRPETAGDSVAAFVGRRLTHGREARAALRPLTGALLRSQYVTLRASLARALGGAPAGPLRDELLDILLVAELEPAVLDAAVEAVARTGGQERQGAERRGEEQGELV